jgi:galactokinase
MTVGIDVLKKTISSRKLKRGWREQALRLLEIHQARFPGPRNSKIAFGFVPGRIEVFGRHTDYAGGRSLVCAIDRGFYFLASPNDDGMIRMRESGAEFEPAVFPFSSRLVPPPGHWANYPMTMARRVARNFARGGAGKGAALKGVDVAFSSTMPVGSGMSGSSALMMMTFTAIAAVNELHSASQFRKNLRDPLDLAVYLACAENGQGFRGLRGDSGVGTFGGSEDHAAILTAVPGVLSLFEFCPATLQEEIPWPRGWRMVVAFCGVRAEKTREALEKYNLVSLRARSAVQHYNQSTGMRFATLREVADHGFGRGKEWLEGLDAGGGREPGLADRVRQFILEDRHYIPAAVEAMRGRDLAAFGRLLSASHRASRRFLWNIAPEIDALQRSATALGAPGASGFGAGFGGSILAVLPADRARAFMADWRARYTRRFPSLAPEARFFLTSPSPGIQLITRDGPARLVDLMFPS